jgi:hypothetical protein
MPGIYILAPIAIALLLFYVVVRKGRRIRDAEERSLQPTNGPPGAPWKAIPEKEQAGSANGLGVLRGPNNPSKAASTTLFVVMTAVCIGLTTMWVKSYSASAEIPVHFNPLTIILVVVSLGALFFTIRFIVFEPTNPEVDSIDFEGLWIASDSVTLGRHKGRLVRPSTMNQIYNEGQVSLLSVAPIESDTLVRIHPSKVELQIHLINSKYKSNDYRIAKLVIGSADVNGAWPTCNLMLSGGNRFVVLGNAAYSCAKSTLADQLRLIATGLHAADPHDTTARYILIKPRSGSNGAILGGQAYLFGAVGGAIAAAVQMVGDSIRTGNVAAALERGQFVNRETCDLLLKMQETQSWKIVVRPSAFNELGIGGSDW